MKSSQQDDQVILDGGLKYTGKLLNGIPHGYGKLVWPNGDSYEGNFKFGKRNGQGKRTNIDGSEYNGEYVDDKPQGRGNKLFMNLHVMQDSTFGKMERDMKVSGKMESSTEKE